MNICVVGTGYVGLVVGVCMADLGFDVTCVDTDARKIEALQAGQVPIYEPGLEPILDRNVREGRLSFTTDGPASVAAAEIVYIAVGTPSAEDGSADLRGVMAVSDLISHNATRDVVVIIKSTVPVGTADIVRERIAANIQYKFDVVSNPEFLKEGAAIKDFTHPDRIIVGCQSEHARDVIRRLYHGLVRTGRPIHFMDNRSAELTKYASNAMLATRISFMNELSQLCERVGADIEAIRRGVGSDTRIGPRFLFAGVGYGGSCFPKDVSALIKTAQAHDITLSISEATVEANQRQKLLLAQKVVRHFGEDLSDKRIAVWGLAFKPQTDDMREAPSVVIINELLSRGAEVVAYDPEAIETAREVLGDRITYAKGPKQTLDGADALLLVTEWSEFRNPRWPDAAQRMRSQVVFDGRNIYDAEEVRAAGFTYYGIGRN